MVDIPRANPLPTGVTDASLGRGLSEGLTAGSEMAYKAAQVTQMKREQALKEQEMTFKVQQQKYTNAQLALERVIPLYDSAPRGTQPALWAFTKKQLQVLNPDLNLPDDPPPSGVGKDLNYFLEQNKRWHQTQGKEGLSDADAHFGASEYLTTESPKWATLDENILKSSPLGTSKTPMSGGPGKPPVNFNPTAGDITPTPGGTPTTSGMPGGTSPADINRQLQQAFLTHSMPLQQSLAAAHAVIQFDKAAAKDPTGASDWPLLENAAVALNPKIFQTIDQVGGLNAQTLPSLQKTGGIPEQIKSWIESKASGTNLTEIQREGIVKAVKTAANLHRTQINSLMQGFGQLGKAQGGNPDQIVTPIIDALPEDVGNTDGQDASAGAALAKKHMSLIPGAVPTPDATEAP